MMPKKSADKSPEPGTLVSSPRGGKLRHGSQPGTNRGGSGRPPSWYREQARKQLSGRIDINGRRRALLDFAAAVVAGEYPEASIRDRLDAWKALVNVALPKSTEVSGPDGSPITGVVILPAPRETDADD